MQKLTPCLWFDNNAEEAVQFYTSVFKDAKAGLMSRYGDAGPGPKGQVMTATLTLFGQEFILLNGGPHFKFNESVSFMVHCDTQEEIDYYWDRLTADGGAASMCGWLKDKFGLSWQITPTIWPKLMTGEPEKAQRAMKAMMQMTKMDIAALQKAYDGV